ncbi:MAG: hypothetical protein JSU77_09850 [Fidelibacterota bacterium]|nr:MAG: hypothetical protein JSU77_09850 [Candidatus Neomarinimicrobiota bacterium]
MNKSARNTDLYHIESSGSADQIGRHYGAALAAPIKEMVQASMRMLRSRYETGRIKVAIEAMSETFRSNFPYLWEEINGICAGTGIQREDFLGHIFRPGVLLFGEEDGCTNIIFPDSDKGPLVGKTHDATTPDANPVVVRVIRPEGVYSVLTIGHLDGISIMTGLNEKGLAVGETSIHFSTVDRSGTVRNLLPRPLLHQCATVKEAVEFLEVHPLLRMGFHFALVDAAGDSAIVERSPTEQNVRWGQGEVMFCTNHTVTPHMRAKELSRGELGDRNSDTRYANLERLVSERDFSTSLESMKTLMKFHDPAGGICQHGDSGYKGPKISFYPMFTQRAFINMAKAGKLLVADGNPCSGEFLEFTLK